MLLTTKEAIEKRRSIRKFKPDPVSQEILLALLDAARRAPSGCNAQPWRFKIVTDEAAKSKLAQAAYGQVFLSQVPVVLVCCADIQGYMEGMRSGIEELAHSGTIDGTVIRILQERAKQMDTQMALMAREHVASRVAFNVAIAVEHIVLRALDFGLGTCWVRLFDEAKVRELFGWDDRLFVVALLPVGFPDESPPPRRRLRVEELVIE